MAKYTSSTVVAADTPEEIAKEAGISADNLIATVDKYNGDWEELRLRILAPITLISFH